MLFSIVPLLSLGYAPGPALAQDLPVQPVQESGASPALNIIPPAARPPVPPPPETPPIKQPLLASGRNQVSVPQAWRIKAQQLFKPNNGLDKNSILSYQLQTGYENAFEAVRAGIAAAGLSLEALSLTSGHMLISSPNDRGGADRAIITLRQSIKAEDNSADPDATDVKIFCESRNRALTLSQLKEIMTQVDAGLSDGKTKTGGQNL
ncbi:MAG: hypothetical protein JST01_10400 [Cyanobacteria bacterium SZAS TMP-1]|nr:hypothetical protein [Cyanobacteria bacterium SZAS TMP-1]